MKEWYSVRMRSSQGGPHEKGGVHISGAERLVEENDVEKIASEMIRRAMKHSRGKADFISLKIDTIQADKVQQIPPLTVKKVDNLSHHSAKQVLQAELANSSISATLLSTYYDWMINDSVTRGAIVIDVKSGKRIDQNGNRGIRVSHFDWDQAFIEQWPEKTLGSFSERRAEAIALASKVVAAGTICELCCSDDPEYTTGYLTIQGKYIQIPNIKEEHSTNGGRVFFIDSSKIDLDEYIHYLEKVPVLVGGI